MLLYYNNIYPNPNPNLNPKLNPNILMTDSPDLFFLTLFPEDGVSTSARDGACCLLGVKFVSSVAYVRFVHMQKKEYIAWMGGRKEGKRNRK